MKHLGFVSIVAVLFVVMGGCRSTKVIRKAMAVQNKDTTQLQASSPDSGKKNCLIPQRSTMRIR